MSSIEVTGPMLNAGKDAFFDYSMGAIDLDEFLTLAYVSMNAIAQSNQLPYQENNALLQK